MAISKSGVMSALLSWVPEDLRIWLLLLLALTSILMVIIFRRELGKLLMSIRRISWNGSKFSLEFGENVHQALQQKNHNRSLTGVNRSGVRPEDSDRPSLSSRDLVIEAWGCLKQNIYDVAVCQKVQLTVATHPLEALSRLQSASTINQAQFDHIALLFKIGQRVADARDYPKERDANIYRDLVFDVLDWMMSNAMVSITSIEPAKVSRKTQAGGDVFPTPSPGKPAAYLIGISGPKKGYQFGLEKTVCSIGSNPDCDLAISEDQYVSGNHAQLKFNNGLIMLVDMNSKNGTYLNGNRIIETPKTVKSGDKIGVGGSIFELI